MEKIDFNHNEITKLLNLKPFRAWNKGDLRPDRSEYQFSSRSAERSNVNRLDLLHSV